MRPAGRLRVVGGSTTAAALLGGGAVAVAALAAPASHPTAHVARAPTAIGVAEREFHITAYRRKLPPGRARLYVSNYGEDTHNLVVKGPRGFRAKTAELAAGERAALDVYLRRPGRYALLCTRANHDKLGMRTTIVVGKPKPKKKHR